MKSVIAEQDENIGNHKGCKGCNHRLYGGCLLRLHYHVEIEKCPCLICLVKVMCKYMCTCRCLVYRKLCELGEIDGIH